MISTNSNLLYGNSLGFCLMVNPRNWVAEGIATYCLVFFGPLSVIIAAVAWLVLNIMMLPMAGAGVFGMKASKMIPVQSLVMHIIYGVVLFYAFGFIGTLF